MADGKKARSYLNRPPAFSAGDWPALGFQAFVLLALSAIILVYLVLAGAYLAMVNEQKGPGSSRASAEIDDEGIILPDGRQRSYFLKSKDAGTIMVVTGLVRNSFPEARRHIKLRGKIVSADGRTLAESFAYAGNIIKKRDLERLSLAEILVRLSDRKGRTGSPVSSKGFIAFMLVFDNPPQGACEYQIEVAGSEPLGTHGAADEK